MLMEYTEQLANNHISVDCVVIGFDGEKLKVLLVKRMGEESGEVFHDMKLPGSLIYMDEDLDDAAKRVLRDLTGLKNVDLMQFKAFGSKDRTKNPKDVHWLERAEKAKVERIVTIAYFAMVKIDKTLNKNLDLNITNYAAFNWAAVATAINILGGVDIDISKAEFYYINAFITETVKGTGIGSVQLKSAGLNHLDGVQAVAYGRLRLMDSDYARVERQRLVIEKAFEKAKSADLMTLESLVAHMVQMCATNIEFGDIFPLAKNMSKYHLGETLGFPSARGDQRIKIGSNRLACIIPQTLVSNVSTLHEFLFGEEDYEPSSAVRSISAHISEVSGMYKEGTEATKAATDQGYIPKATEAAETEAPEELEQSSEGESTSEGESGESLGAEDGTRYPRETLYPGQTLAPGETLAPGQTLAPGETLYPGQTRPGTRPGESESARYPGDTGQTSGASETTGSRRPGSPADIVPTTEAPYGPGFESQSSPVQEATTAASPGTRPTTGSSSSIIVVDPPAGNSSGPARETTAASPGPASAGGSAAGNSPSGNGTSTGNGPSSQPVPVQPGTTGGPGTALQNP